MYSQFTDADSEPDVGNMRVHNTLDDNDGWNTNGGPSLAVLPLSQT